MEGVTCTVKLSQNSLEIRPARFGLCRIDRQNCGECGSSEYLKQQGGGVVVLS
jgi:hypothetical protein